MYNRLRKIWRIILVILMEAVLIDGLCMILYNQTDQIVTEQQNARKLEEMIMEDLRCFPIPLAYRSDIFYVDSFGAARGNGDHEGCDLMDSQNKAGRIPIISATDGVVTNIGWLYLGGYRIGITSQNNLYYYYAHMDSYAEGIQCGTEIKAGELLGFMGNTGEGEEGTQGKFDVHLHFGIYKRNENGNEESVNPYPFLQEIGQD